MIHDTTLGVPTVDYTPTAGTIQCTWKDQGWANREGKLNLKVIAPDGSEKASFTVEGFATHEQEEMEVTLVATDVVLAEATDECTYQIMTAVGGGGSHELHSTNLVLRLSRECEP